MKKRLHRSARNKKGIVSPISTGLELIGQLVLFGILFFIGIYVNEGIAVGQVQAENTARNIGITFDVTAGIANEITITNACPDEAKFNITGSRITVKYVSALVEYQADYNYLHESNADLPLETIIDCTPGSKMIVEKTIVDDGTGSLASRIRVRME